MTIIHKIILSALMCSTAFASGNEFWNCYSCKVSNNTIKCAGLCGRTGSLGAQPVKQKTKTLGGNHGNLTGKYTSGQSTSSTAVRKSGGSTPLLRMKSSVRSN